MRYCRYIFIVIALMISCVMLAQPRLRRPEIYIGGHAGVMASSMLFNPSVTGIDIIQSPLSVNGGLVFRYAGHKVCAIQVEANYMQRGWREKGDGFDYRRQLEYIEVPLLMHLYLGGQHFRGFLNLGPQIGYCFSDTEYGTKNPNQTHQYIPIQNPFDWGLAAGLGCYIHTKKAGIYQLEARFNYSLSDTFSNSKMAYFSSSHAMVASVNLAYLFEIKVKKKKR